MAVTASTQTSGDVQERRFGAPLAARIAGISYRQIDHWDRTGVCQPSIRQPGGSGTNRVYSTEDVLVLCVLRELSRMGVRLIQLGIGTEIVRQAIRRGDRYLVISPSGETESCDDKMVSMCMTAHGTIAAWVLDLAAITGAVDFT